MDDAGQYGLLSGITTITEAVSAGLDTVLGSTGWSLSDAEARDAVEALSRTRARIEAVYLHALRILDSRPDALDGAGKGKVAAAFLVGRLHVDGPAAAADVRAAQALDPDDGVLAELGAGLAAGEVSRAHVDAAVAAVAKLPKAVLAQRLSADDGADDEGAECTDDAGSPLLDCQARPAELTGAQFVDRWLAAHARQVQHRVLRAMARGLRDRVDPDHEDRSFDPDAHSRRSVSLRIDPLTGVGSLHATLMAADAAAFAAFLRSATRPAAPVETLREEPDGAVTSVEVRDERSAAARRYDATMALFRSALAGRSPSAAATPTGGSAGLPAQLLVTATLDQVVAAASVATGTPVPAAFAAAGRGHLDRVGDLHPGLLAYLSCTASVQRLLLSPSGQVLDVGRAGRFATTAQRRAAAVRDGGCVIPGCPCPAEDVDLHHVVHWAAGGPTDLANLVSLCSRHHQETHAGIWTVQIGDGVVRVRPPTWIDPQQR